MKRSELKNLIREAVEEVMNEFAPLGVANEGVPSQVRSSAEKSGGSPAAYKKAWKKFYSRHGDAKQASKQVKEMWLATKENMNEKLDPHASASKWIDDFVNSDDPKFSGKSKEKRKEMALGAYYAARRKAGLKTEDHDPDQIERDDYNRQIDRHNRKNPQRFECPNCKTPDALSAWEKKKGYQCKSCADTEEGLYEAKEGGEGADTGVDDHDETDMSNPEENKEVNLASQIKKLADEILAMHGVPEYGDEEAAALKKSEEDSEDNT